MRWTIAEEIDKLSKLAGIPCIEFRHLIVCANFAFPDEQEAQTIATYTPAANITWLVTYLFLRSLPVVNDPDLTVVATSSGDFRSDDVDPSGLSLSWIEVNGNPLIGVDTPSFALFNKPVLFAFKGDEVVTIQMRRPNLSVPATTRIHLALSGYVAPPQAYDCLARNLTRIEGFSS